MVREEGEKGEKGEEIQGEDGIEEHQKGVELEK